MSLRKLTLVALLVSLHLVGAALVLAAWLEHWRIEKNETQAVSDLIHFGEWSLSVASRVNNGGLPAPEARSREGYPQSFQALPSRFVSSQRHGYRFGFKGFRSAPPRGQVWVLAPAYQAFIYTALPVVPGKSGRRTFSLLSGTMAVHYRDDGAIPTFDDPVIKRLSR